VSEYFVGEKCNWVLIQSKFSTIVALMTEEIGCCREVTVMGDITSLLGGCEAFYFLSMFFSNTSDSVMQKPNRNNY